MSEVVDITCPHCHKIYQYRVQAPSVQLVNPDPEKKNPPVHKNKESKIRSKLEKVAAFLFIGFILFLVISSALKNDGKKSDKEVNRQSNISTGQVSTIDNNISNSGSTNQNQSKVVYLSDVEKLDKIEQGTIYIRNGIHQVDTDGDGHIDKIY